MRHKEITIEPKLFADILVVIGFIVCCFIYIAHYSEIQNEANAILTSSIEGLNSSLANSSSTGR